MKRFFVPGLVILSLNSFSAETPVSVESFLAKNGDLSFKLQNYSKDQAYDCVVTYDLATYDEDHAYVRTAANLQTKVIFMDKNSTKRIKSEFELAAGEKIAELYHMVKTPSCVPSTRSRAVLLKNFINFENYALPNRPAFPNMVIQKLLIKADFTDITQFEVSAVRDLELRTEGGFSGGYGMMNPESFPLYYIGFEFLFLNKRNQLQLVEYTDLKKQNSKQQNQQKKGIFKYDSVSKKIVDVSLPKDVNCGPSLSSSYLVCHSLNSQDVFFVNAENNLSRTKVDATVDESYKDFRKDAEKVCGSVLSTVLRESGDSLVVVNRCLNWDNGIERFDIKLEKDHGSDEPVFKFVSYENIPNSIITRDDIRRDFPFALMGKMSLKSMPYDVYAAKEDLITSIKRLFNVKQAFFSTSIINVDSAEYFDVLFEDDNKDLKYGRIYWNDLK